MVSVFIPLALYIALLLAVGYLLSKKESKEDYLIAGRKRSKWIILFSKFAGAIGASWFVTYTAFAYEFGLWIYAILVGFIIGYFLFAYWAAPKIYRHSKENNLYTQGDYVEYHLKSKTARGFTEIVSILIQAFWLLISVVGGAKIMSYFGILSYEASVIITGVVILSYLLLSGFKAVLITDLIQATILLTLLAIIAVSMTTTTSVTSLLTTQTQNLGIGSIVGFLLYGILSVFALADRFQLCFAAKDEKSLKQGIGFAIIPILIAAFFLLLIGLFVFIKNPSLDPGLVFLEALKTYLSPAFMPYALVLFFAALMSSADTAVYTIASHYTFWKKSKSPRKTVATAALMVVLILCPVALLYRDIVGINVIAGAVTITLSLPIVYLLSGGKNKRRYLTSLIGGFIGLFLGILLIGVTPALILPVVIGSAIGLLKK